MMICFQPWHRASRTQAAQVEAEEYGKLKARQRHKGPTHFESPGMGSLAS